MTSDTNSQTSVRRARRKPTESNPASSPAGSIVPTASAAGAAKGEPKPGSKTALLLDLLKDGATVSVLSDRLGWLPHTVRAALTGLRKRGIGIVKNRDAEGTTVYSVQPGA